MIADKTQVRLRFPLFRGGLSLSRTPKYLRFVVKGLASCSRNWDALDQLDDVPSADEQILAAVLDNRGSVHVDRTVKGRRVGEWHKTAEYVPAVPQPAQDVMRDNEKWRQWCLEQEKTGSQENGDTDGR